MSSDAPFTPPKKKPSVFWWIGGAFVLLASLFFYQLFGPNPAIEISPQTTHITGPLRPNGLPDYEKYVVDRWRDGVTPENNAATLLWPAVCATGLDPQEYLSVTAELGLKAILSKDDAIVPVDKIIESWLKSQQPQVTVTGSAEIDIDAQSDAIFDQVTNRPWTSEQFPWLVEWINDNKQQLDTMVAGSKRSRCYIPSPTAINGHNDLLVAMLLPGQQDMREAGRALLTRGMWNVGEHRPMEAWQDLLAVHRIGRLVTQGPTIVEQYIGISIDSMGTDGTIAMLQSSKLTPVEARQIIKDLDALEPFSNVANCFDNIERLEYLDTVIVASHDLKEALGDDSKFNYLRHFRINWNIALRKGNEIYDQLAAAARQPTFETRQKALTQFDRDIKELASRARPDRVLRSGLDSSSRGLAVANALISEFLPVISVASEAQDCANAMLDLKRLAAALAVYRAEHDKYPEKLDDLVPSVLAKLPVDLYHAKPFIYQRIDDGYLLYTAGPNGIDDNGSNDSFKIYQGTPTMVSGKSLSAAMEAKIPIGADDISIRVPLPQLDFPESSAP